MSRRRDAMLCDPVAHWLAVRVIGTNKKTGRVWIKEKVPYWWTGNSCTRQVNAADLKPWPAHWKAIPA